MRPVWSRTLSALVLSIVSIGLIWGGHALNEAGRTITAQDFSFAADYYFGAQLLWMLAGAVGAAVISQGAGPGRDGSGAPLLIAAIVPIAILLPVYVWWSPRSPSWLLEIVPRSEWLISPFVTAASAVLAGVLLGAGLLTVFRSTRTSG